MEHAQVFLLLSFPKQYRLTAIDIALTSGGDFWSTGGS